MRFKTGLAVSLFALVAAIALEAAWLGSDELRLKAALAQLGSAIAFLGVVAALVAATDRPNREKARFGWIAPVAMVVNGLIAVGSVALVQVGLPVPPLEGPFYADGSTLPEFEVPLADTAKQPVKLADFRGEPLVLVFYRGPW